MARTTGEDIYERQRDVDRGDADSSIRDRDIVFAIVIDRSAETGDNEDTMSGSFTVTARDEDGNSMTETIVIKVANKNVDIAEDDGDNVVAIKGDPSGTAPLTMDVDLGLDPDLGDADDATLVVYTWITIAPGGAETVQMVSSTPQPLPIANRDGSAIYDVGTKFKATVQYYEIDPDTHQIAQSEVYEDESDATVAPEDRPEATTVSFEVTTSPTGVSAVITTTGDAEAVGTARLQASSNGTSGWINVDSAAADTSATGSNPVTVTLTVDEDGDDTGGDGGGLHYRVVYSYTHNGRTVTEHYDVGRLGTLADPTAGATTDIIGGVPDSDEPDVGETLRIATDGNDADVQWQYRESATKPWMDIDGATSLTLRVTSDYTGKMLRAKVTYTGDDNSATTDVNEDGWPVWVEYTEVLTVDEVDATNDVPATTGEDSEIEVELGAMVGMNQPTKVVMFDASDLFHDPDGDALTYSITAAATGATFTEATSATAPGNVAELAGGLVWRVHKSVWDADATPEAAMTTDDLQQSLVIDSKTGEITYFTDQSHTHDGSDTDGEGNMLTFTISATDNDAGTTTPPTQNVTVRINVAPTAIETGATLLSGTGTADITNAVDTALSDKKTMPTALVIADPDGASETDTDGVSDPYTIEENVRNQPAVQLVALDVQDENLTSHKYGTHSWTVSDKRFEVVKDADQDGSTWILQLKRGATFDYEDKSNPNYKDGTLTVTITATDGGGLKTSAHFSIQISDVEEEAPTRPPAPDPEPETVPGLEDDADDSDEDGPVVPPGDGGAFIDDLLDQFVISIDDIDIA